MSNQMRWRHGDTKPAISKTVLSETVIQVGDLIAVDTGNDDVPIPASDVTWDTDLATTQEAFHDAFLGVSGQQSKEGATDGVRHNSRGVHEFDCAPAQFTLGDLVGPAKATGDALENQKVVAVASANLAIGRVAKYYDSNTDKVFVEVFSTVHSGGVQAPA